MLSRGWKLFAAILITMGVFGLIALISKFTDAAFLIFAIGFMVFYFYNIIGYYDEH